MGDTFEYFYSGPSYLEAYFKSLPNLYDNPVGKYAHDCVVNQLKMSVKGSTRYPVAMETTYKDWFFEGVSELPGQQTMIAQSDITPAQWAEYSAIYVCETIQHVTTETKNCVNADLVIKDKKKLYEFLNGSKSYRSILTVCKNPVQEAYKLLNEKELETAKDDYCKAITDPAWVDIKIIQAQKSIWKDADWELYHHWSKLMLLGATESEVLSIIRKLKDMGLPIDESVDETNWDSYERWMGTAKGEKLEVGWEDFKEAESRMLSPVCYPNGILVHEYFSLNYMHDEEGGNRYYVEPPKPEISCFTAEAMVRMADGTLRKISEIRSGDRIFTPQGEKRVLFVSTPLRGKRSLYSFGNHKFKFSESHPFRSKKGHVCVKPDILGRFVPTFKEVEALVDGTKLMTYSGTDAEVAELYAHGYEECNKCELLYDIIPEADKSGVFEYYIGDEREQYLVSSEMPILTGREYETMAFTKLFDVIVVPLLQASGNVPVGEYWEKACPVFTNYMQLVLLPKLGELDLADGFSEVHCPLDSSLFLEYAEMFNDHDTNIRIGYLFSTIFETLLPILLQLKVSLSMAEKIGNIIKDDIENGILKFQ